MKTVLITGASCGIGAAAARRFAAAGYTVLINYNRSAQQAHALCDEIRKNGGIADCYQADVSDRAQVERMVADAVRAHGRIDTLINNAGIGRQQLFTDISSQDWREMLGVHLDGAFHCIQTLLPEMIRQKQGVIVNVSSMWGQVGASCEVHYSTAKAGLIGLTKALAKEVGPSGIRVNCVAPGVIDTKMNGALSAQDMAALCEETPLGRIGTPEEIAETLLFLCSDSAAFITGQVVAVNGGFVI